MLGDENPAATNFDPANIFSTRSTKRNLIEIFTGTSTFRMALKAALHPSIFYSLREV
jgi:hypothetical protein